MCIRPSSFTPPYIGRFLLQQLLGCVSIRESWPGHNNKFEICCCSCSQEGFSPIHFRSKGVRMLLCKSEHQFDLPTYTSADNKTRGPEVAEASQSPLPHVRPSIAINFRFAPFIFISVEFADGPFFLPFQCTAQKEGPTDLHMCSILHKPIQLASAL